MAYTNNPHSWPRACAAVLSLAIIGVGVAPAAAAPCRLVERQAGGDRHALAADGTLRRVLDPTVAEHRIVLEPPCDGAQLTFDVGRGPAAGGPVRFELLLQAAGKAPASLFSRDVSAPGWESARVDLGPHEAGAELVFRRIAAGGDLAHSAWGNPTVLDGAAERPSIVLLSIDTLRADRLGSAGQPGDSPPALRALAGGGVTYRDAYSASTWTVPSHAALFHGSHIARRPAAPGAAAGQGAADPPLAERLLRAGWATAAFTGGGYLSPRFRFHRGFDTFYSFARQPAADVCREERFDGPEVFRRATEWVRGHASTPFFLFIHTYDVHDRCPFEVGARTPAGSPAAEREELFRYYDRLLADTDARIGALLRALDEQGLASKTVVVVTSDHGESFFEHDQHGHGCDKAPYQEIAHVPLIVRVPGASSAGSVIATPVSAIDLAPSLLRLAGLPVPSGMHGRSLPGLGLDGPRRADDPVFVHCGDRLAVRAGPHKLLTSHAGEPADELYDLDADPAERHDLREAEPAVLARLRQLAAAFWTGVEADASRPPGAAEIDAATREQLRVLGYGE